MWWQGQTKAGLPQSRQRRSQVRHGPMLRVQLQNSNTQTQRTRVQRITQKPRYRYLEQPTPLVAKAPKTSGHFPTTTP